MDGGKILYSLMNNSRIICALILKPPTYALVWGDCAAKERALTVVLGMNTANGTRHPGLRVWLYLRHVR